MQHYAAFLRGMNLGRRRVRNEELVEAFEGLGFQAVSAFLASGNVMFATLSEQPKDALVAALEAGLRARFDYEVPVFLRTAGEVAAIAAAQPFSDADHARSKGKLQVALLLGAPGPEAVAAALALDSVEDRLAVEGATLYWLPKGRMSDSALDLRALAKALGSMTIRTHNTMARLAAKLGE